MPTTMPTARENSSIYRDSVMGPGRKSEDAKLALGF
jgi:hypothetical protein